MSQNRHEQEQQILGRVKRDEFIGRAGELERLVSHANQKESSGLLVLAKPFAGLSELLRQTFDSVFPEETVVPIYFELPSGQTTVVSAAIEFLNTFLLQYVAHRRREPDLCHASLTLNDLQELAPTTDSEWISALVAAYNQHRFDDDDQALVRFCLNAVRRVPGDVRPFVMFNATELGNYDDDQVPFVSEIVRALAATRSPYVLAGLRREVLDAVQSAHADLRSLVLMKLEALGVEDSRALVGSIARRHEVPTNEEARDLLTQQLEGSPYFITTFIQAAADKRLALDSYFACERLYVDELMGGKVYRQLAAELENIAPEPNTRSALIRVLCEAVPEGKRTVSAVSWRQRLKLSGVVTEKLLRLLHVHELINWNGETITLDGGSTVWRDFLRARFRLDALREPRALVVAELMAAALRRAPQTVARYFRRANSLSLLELLAQFNTQTVPRKLFQFDEFAALYKGATQEEIAVGLETDADHFRLPQVFHAASGISFSSALRSFGEESTVVAHAFAGATYTEPDEVVWLVAKAESKLAANVELVEKWFGLLEGVARQSGFVRTQLWLISNEGFSAEACELLRARGAFGSSRQQLDLLSNLLSPAGVTLATATDEDEFSLVIPMGEDNELLAALTVEQLARRLEFTPEAINQIKTAVVEACINAAEHSLSPDRKIYQRFRVESDKLVITISSRGVLPPGVGEEGNNTPNADEHLTGTRRGWGLKLIKTLMDEVEFERVDEGTRLRMTKYLRRTQTAKKQQ
ncbi:MAG TPA: ATP-binding protein [Pyrinomonadaceae bacterium]|nr:ATP-binding protein [Pyrinomonadaceae bacterium]